MTDKGFRRLQIERQFQYNIGMFLGFIFASMGYLFIVGTGTFVHPMLIAGAMFLPLLSLGGKAMRAFYKMYRWFKHTDMRFDALCKFFNFGN